MDEQNSRPISFQEACDLSESLDNLRASVNASIQELCLSFESKFLDVRGHSIAQLLKFTAENASSEVVVRDLAMLVKRLSRAIAKNEPRNPIVEQASDYLKRMGLSGSPLRAEDDEKGLEK